MATIFHLALERDWARAQTSGAYAISTLGRTLAEEGFIHASRADQWTGVRDRFYAEVTEPLVLLQIDTDLLDVPVLEEPAMPGGTETFPHIYGRLPVTAVTKAIPVPGASAAPAPVPTEPVAPAPVAPAPARRAPTSATDTGRPAAPPESFSRVFLREMFFNAAVAMLAIVFSCIGIGIGLAAFESDKAPGIGGLVGLAVGIALAAVLYHRRKAARRSLAN